MRVIVLVTLAVILVLALHVAGYASPSWSNWGAHHYGLLPGAWLALGSLAALLAGAGWWIAARRAGPPVGGGTLAVALVAGTAAFWFLRERAIFLGDGPSWIRALEEGRFAAPAEPGPVWILSALNRLPGPPDPRLLFAVLGAGCGALFLWAAWAFSRLAGRDRATSLFVFLLLAFAGFTRLFYGYVETAPLLAVATLVFLLVSIRHLEAKGTFWIPAGCFFVAVMLHASAVWLLPALLHLAWRAPRDGRAGGTRWVRIGAPVALLIALVVAVWGGPGRFLELAGFAGGALPSGGSAGGRIPYALGSPGHLSDFFQEQLLAGPFAALLALPLALLAGRRGIDRTGGFLLAAALPWWLVSFAASRPLGAAREWDLFAAASIPLVAFAGWTLARLPWRKAAPATASVLMALLLAVSAWHTAGWVLADVNEEIGLRRIALLHGPGSHASPAARAAAFGEIATWYLDRGDAASAEVALTEAHRAAPENPGVAGNLGSVRLALGRVDEALALLDQAAARDSTNEVVVYQLGKAYRAAGRPVEAAAAYRRALARNPDFRQASLALALLAREAGRPAEAEAVLRAARERFPHDGEILTTLGGVYEELGRPEEAAAAYQAALLETPGDSGAAFNLARLHLRGKRFQEAAHLLEGVVAGHPEDMEAWVNLGVARMELGRVAESTVALETAKALAPRRPEPYFNLAQLAMRQGNLVGAKAQLETWVAIDSTSEAGLQARALVRRLAVEIAAAPGGNPGP